ncbi:hypothetical protein MBLNU13_g07656t1 [Cladosporium sp. NU13]
MAESRVVQGYIDPNFPNPMTESSATIIIYGYTPSLAVGVLGVVLFAIALAAHLFLLLRRRTWYFSTVVVGTAMEIVGYAFRILSSQQNPYSVPWFVVQYFFIVVAPVFFSAAIYSLVSVMISIYGREYAPMPPKLVLWVFIVCDVAATIIQVAGAALVGIAYSNQEDPTTPNNILLAGLAFQVFSFAVFLVVLFWTLVKARKSPASISRSFIAALVVATLAVYLRTCFRLAETAEGLMASLSTHEVYFGCLEFAPVVVAVMLLVYWHPGRWLPGSSPLHKSEREFGQTASDV